MRGGGASILRLIRGRESLPPGRSKACPVLNMMADTLAFLLAEFRAPLFQLRKNALDAGGLLNRGHPNTAGFVSIAGEFRELNR